MTSQNPPPAPFPRRRQVLQDPLRLRPCAGYVRACVGGLCAWRTLTSASSHARFAFMAVGEQKACSARH